MMKKKMKLIVIVSIVVVAVGVLNLRLSTQKTNTHASLFSIEALTEELSPTEEEILLHGSLILIPVRSYSQPFNAIKYSSHINVYYSVNLSNITIQIVKGSGQTVYSNTINPTAGGQLYISLAGLTSGDYTIVFTAPNGNSIYGDFEI
jgi:hypothetical protein